MGNLEESKYRDNGILPSPSASRGPRLPFIHRRIARSLVPTFLSRSDSQDPVRPTDFLDGMRGYAAFGVFFGHFIIGAHPKAHIGYGGGNGRTDHYIPQLPIIRLLYSGQMGVFLFFVISGFSISLKPIKQARRGAYPALFDTLASATFRRAARLYLPCITILFITLLLTCFGAYDFAQDLTHDWPFPGKPLPLPVVYDSITDQISHMVRCFWVWADPLNFAKPEQMPYASQLWTIPVELRCSFFTFVAILGLAKVRSNLRIAGLSATAVYLHLKGHPEVPLFLAGTVLAELHVIRSEKNPQPEERKGTKIRNILIWIFGLFLASYPRHGGDKAPYWKPFYPIGAWTVGDEGKQVLYFFTSIAAVLLVYIVDKSPFLQSLYTTPIARYLGKTSFALYCVHQALINWFGYRSILFWWSIFGNDTIMRYELGIGIAFVVQTVVTMWASDLFYKFVDHPSVGFGRWLERLCSAET